MNMSQFLLIHGAFHGAWCWHKAIPEFEKRGHRAQAIDLPGQGQDQTPLGKVTLDTMVDRIVTALTEIAGPVVLVGHSLAGMVISATAEKAPDRIKTLVAVIWPRTPCSIGYVARRAGKGRWAGDNNVEFLVGGYGSEQVGADGAYPILDPVCSRVLGRRQHRVGVFVNGSDGLGAGPRRGKGEDSRSSAHISDSLSLQIKSVDNRGKEFAR
jgi:hypothetical protein